MTPERWAEIKEIFSAALERPEHERGRWLDSVCRGDGPLRAEIERLLAQDDGSLKSPAALVLPQAMPDLAAGDMLSHYRIEAKVGQGGMGAVYRAYDTELHRQVALKLFLSEHVADSESKRRLLREARAASALNHPNIVAVYEVGSDNSLDFIAMEFVEGKSLNEVIPVKGLAIEKALDYALQITGGLAKAHSAGVIHRDLKPGNIMLTRDGLVKLLDFGLARRVRLDQRHDTTLSAEWEIAGTPAFMSPEQVRGEPLDHRSDIFSFGCVMYQMLTGERAFPGVTSVEMMNGILNEEPAEFEATRSGIPAGLERIVRHCLEKNAEDRFQSAGDLVFDLQGVSPTPDRTAPASHRVGKWRVVATALSVLAALAIVLAVTIMLSSRTESSTRSPGRLTITLPGEAPLAPPGLVSPGHDRPALALSPNGAYLAYVAQVGGKSQICIRDMMNGKVTSLAGTERGHTPFFSPDGTSIGFFGDGKLKRISRGSGAVEVLADAPNPWGAVWGIDNAIYFNRYEGEGILRVAAEGGPVQVVSIGQSYMPELLGRGPRLLATSGAGTIAIDREQMPKLVIAGFGARYVPTGHLVYALPGKLMSVPFDRSRAEVTGRTVSLCEDLRTASYGVAQFTLAQEGTLIYASGRDQGITSFVWVDREGKTRPLGLPEDVYSAFALSPDGKRLALVDGQGEIWIYELSRGAMSRLTPRISAGSPATNAFPRWAPDGRHVVYARRKGSQHQLLWAPVDGSTEAVELWSQKRSGPEWLYPMSFSPDGSVLAVFGPSANRSFDTFLIRIEGNSPPRAEEPELFLGSSFSEAFGQISPDGHWMLYASDRSGRYEIYVTSYPRPDAVYQISRNGGREPVWNPRGAEILYLDGMQMYAVGVSLGRVFHAGEPRLLFEGPYPDVPGLGYGISPDGQRFLMLENKDVLKPSRTLDVVTNFFDLLRRRVPSGSGKQKVDNNGAS